MKGNEAKIRKQIYGESQDDSHPRELGSHHLKPRSRHICTLTCLSSFQSNSSLCSPIAPLSTSSLPSYSKTQPQCCLPREGHTYLPGLDQGSLPCRP